MFSEFSCFSELVAQYYSMGKSLKALLNFEGFLKHKGECFWQRSFKRDRTNHRGNFCRNLHISGTILCNVCGDMHNMYIVFFFFKN